MIVTSREKGGEESGVGGWVRESGKLNFLIKTT